MSRVRTVRARYPYRKTIVHSFQDGVCTICHEPLDALLTRRYGRMGAYRGRRPIKGQTQLPISLTVYTATLRHFA